MDKYHQSNPPELKSVVMGRQNSRKGASSPAPCSALLLAVHQIDENKWQSMVVVEHQTIGFGPLCDSEEECQWWCSQFKAALGRAGARFISPNVV
jgi:hypothetical protein